MLRSPSFYPLAPIRTPARTVFVRGEGSYLYDSCGKRYLDANSGLWNLPLGTAAPILFGRWPNRACTASLREHDQLLLCPGGTVRPGAV